jgi:hypothetical protein
MKNPSEREIHQLHLACFLLVKGHRLLRIEPVPGKAFSTFVFANDDKMASDRMDYFEHKTSVDPLAFYNQLTDLKKKAMTAQQQFAQCRQSTHNMENEIHEQQTHQAKQ